MRSFCRTFLKSLLNPCFLLSGIFLWAIYSSSVAWNCMFGICFSPLWFLILILILLRFSLICFSCQNILFFQNRKLSNLRLLRWIRETCLMIHYHILFAVCLHANPKLYDNWSTAFWLMDAQDLNLGLNIGRYNILFLFLGFFALILSIPVGFWDIIFLG